MFLVGNINKTNYINASQQTTLDLSISVRKKIISNMFNSAQPINYLVKIQ